jgi:1,4-dihydroxy-2-naphthoate octaprenyltransferase
MRMKMNRQQLSAMVKLGRPFVVIAGLIAFLYGSSMAYHDLGVLSDIMAILGLIIMVSAIFMAHYANEYADQDTDALTRRTWFSGGSGVLPSGIVPPRWSLYSSILFLLITAFITMISLISGWITWSAVLLVIIGLLGGWLYSMPPLRLERTRLGEVTNAVLGGFLMTLIGYVVQTGYLTANAFLACIPVAISVFVNLLGVHWPDIKADESVGKRTLVVRMGERIRMVYAASLVLMYASGILMFGWVLPPLVVAGLLLTVPVSIWGAWQFTRKPHPLPHAAIMVSVMVFMSVGWFLSRG